MGRLPPRRAGPPRDPLGAGLGHVFEDISRQRAEDRAAERQRARDKLGFGALAATHYLDTAALLGAASSATDYGAIAARREGELHAADDRAAQQVEDCEAEYGRLQQANAEIVRPDARLGWGVAILVIFTAVGVGLPMWAMSQSPASLAAVRWLFYPFAGALALLTGRVQDEATPAASRPLAVTFSDRIADAAAAPWTESWTEGRRMLCVLGAFQAQSRGFCARQGARRASAGFF